MNESIFKSYGKAHDLLWDANIKWYNLGIALEVDPNTLEGIRITNQNNCNVCFNAMLKSCSETNSSITWTGVCEALRKPSVARIDVAKKIEEKIPSMIRKRSHQNSVGGSSDSDAYEETFEEKPGAPATSPPLVPYKRRNMRNDSTAEHEKMDLETESESIDNAFIKLRSDTIKSLTKKTSPEDLVDYLQNFGRKKAAVKHEDGENEVLANYFDDLEKDDSIKAIFKRIRKFMSFLDYHLLEKIIDEHGDEKDNENLTKYIKKLTVFLENWQVEPLVVNESTEDQTKLKFKLDTYSLTCYNQIKTVIANLFQRHSCEVVVTSIDSGCVELVFALPMTAVERLPSLTLSQIAEVAEWTPTVLNVTVVDGSLKDSIIYGVPISEMVLQACRNNTPPNVDLVRNYLEQNSYDVNIREDDEFKWSSLMWALENKHFEIAKLLLKYKPEVRIQDKKGWSPLVLACRAGDLEIVQGIVALGAEIDLPTDEGWTPLMWAAQEGHAEMARFLLEKGAFVDFPDENGWTPVMQASQGGHVDVMNILLDHNAKVSHLTSSTTWCALMAAAKNKHSDAVDTLLKRGAQVDIQRDDGSTTLQVASYYSGNSGIIDTLINHGANVDHVNKDDMTALMLASSKGHLDVVQALRSGGADLNKEHTGSGWTALFFAAKAGNCDVFRELLCRGAVTETSSDKVENVAHMSASHEELLSDLGKYKKISEWKKDAEKLAHERTRKAMEALERFAQNLSPSNTCSSEVRASAKLLNTLGREISCNNN